MCTAHRTAPGGRTVALGQHPGAGFAECRGDGSSLSVRLKRLNRQCCGDEGITIRCQAPLPTRLLRAKEPAHGLTRWASIGARRSSQCRQRPCSVLRIAGVAFRSTKPAVGVLVEHQRSQMGGRNSGQLLGQGLPGQYLHSVIACGLDSIQQLRRNRPCQRFECCGCFRPALQGPCYGCPLLSKAAIGLNLGLQPRHASSVAGPHRTRKQKDKSTAQPLRKRSGCAAGSRDTHGDPLSFYLCTVRRGGEIGLVCCHHRFLARTMSDASTR